MPEITTDKAPAAIGPYSQGVAVGNLVFTSGQIPLDPATGAMLKGDIGAQTERAILNVKAVLEAGGSSLERVVKTTVYLRHMEDFAAMNAVYSRYFSGETLPARSCVEVGSLPKDALVEIEAVAER